MTTRRKFLQASAAALPMLSRSLFAQGRLPIGLQLSTLVKQQIPEAQLVGNLRQIAAIGFREVEPWHAAYFLPAAQLRKDIRDSGLTVPSGHFEYADLTAALPAQLAYAKALGLKWVVCPMLPKSQWTSAGGFRTAARQFNGWATQVQQAGMRFAFHNHDYEFQRFGDQTGYDILVRETDPALVSFELDCYWIAQAGLDPLHVLNQLGKRVRLLHVKDRKPGFPPSHDMNESSAHFTEVGTGSLDWPAILAAAEKLEIEHYFIEQDHIDGPPLESLRKSYSYLSKILP